MYFHSYSASPREQCTMGGRRLAYVHNKMPVFSRILLKQVDVFPLPRIDSHCFPCLACDGVPGKVLSVESCLLFESMIQ